MAWEQGVGGLKMEKKRIKRPFIDELLSSFSSFRDMKPGETHVINVNANYGRYQIVIICKKRGGKDGSIEIDGKIHHLFLSPDGLSVMPSKEQIAKNLNNTVILKNLEVHIRDPKGDGKHMATLGKQPFMQPDEYINLTGKDAETMLNRIRREKRASLAAYKIVQMDILNALRKRGKEKKYH